MKNDMEWGYYTWLLFHTLAEKIKDEEFEKEKNNLIYFVKNICSVLPCPECSSHAIHLLKYYNYNHIRSKDDFKKFIFEFHNIVNKRKKFKIQDISVLNMYKNAILYKIVYAWNYYFNVKGINTKLLTENMNRNRVKKNFMKYINDNKHKFN
tara:strand:+ start:687 stop:1142 length:456 start_codon:yes stop_codon:yes gene_type:complete